MAISRAKLLKRMADSAVVEARKKGILKKVTEKPLSKKPPSAGKILKALKSDTAIAGSMLGGAGYMGSKVKKELDKMSKEVKEEEARQKKAKNKKKGMKAGGIVDRQYLKGR